MAGRGVRLEDHTTCTAAAPEAVRLIQGSTPGYFPPRKYAEDKPLVGPVASGSSTRGIALLMRLDHVAATSLDESIFRSVQVASFW